MIQELADLEWQFSAYLNPLQESLVNVSFSPSKTHGQPSRNSSAIVERAKDFVSSRHSIGGATSITSKAFKCIYKSSLTRLISAEKLDVFKKHQLFIVSLLEAKQFKECGSELEYVYSVIQKDSCREKGASGNWLLEGVSLDSKIPPNLVIAFNFLYFQFTIQSFSRRLKSENLENLKSIVALLSSESNFSKWLNMSSSKEKHYTNLLKLVNSLLKIVDHILIKGYWDEGNDILAVKKSLSLKEIEYLINIGNQNIDYSTIVPQVLNLCHAEDELTTQCILDLKQRLPTESITYDILNESKTKRDDASNNLLPLNISQLIKDNPTTETILSILDQYFQLSEVQSIESLLKQTNPVDMQVLEIIVIYIEYASILRQSQLGLLDLLVVKLKGVITAELREIDSPNLIFRILSNSFTILSNCLKLSRIRNISNLLFNLGNKRLASRELSIKCWKLCIQCEEFVYRRETTSKNEFQLQYKIEKIVNSLYETEDFLTSNELLLKYLNLISVQQPPKDILHSIEDLQKPLIFQLLVKCIASNSAITTSLWGESAAISDVLKATLYVKVLGLLEKSSNINEKTEMINGITKSLVLKNEVNKLVCLYTYLNINGLTEQLPIDIISLNNISQNSTAQLFKSAAHFQTVARDGWNFNHNENIIKYFQLWLLHEDLPDLEVKFGVEFLKKILHYLSCNDMKKEALELCQLSYQNLKLSLLDKGDMNLIEARLDIKPSSLHLLKSAGDQLKSMKIVDIDIHSVLNWKLVQFEYSLVLKDKDVASKYLALATFISTKLNLEDSGIPIQRKLDNLLLVARFRYLSGKYFRDRVSYLKSYENFKMVIKILHSVIKRIGNNFPMQNYLRIKWEITGLLVNSYFEIVNISIKLGISKDLRYYLETCESFLNLVRLSPAMNKLYWFKLSNLFYLLNNEDKFLEFSKKAGAIDIQDKLHGMDQELNQIIILDFQRAKNANGIMHSRDQVEFKEALVLFDYLRSLLFKPAKGSATNSTAADIVGDEYYQILKKVLYYKDVMIHPKSTPQSLISAFDFFSNLSNSVSKMELLATYEVKDIIKSLCRSALILSSKLAEEIRNEKGATSSLSKKLFSLQDFSRELPFAYERAIYRDYRRNILPTIDEIKISNQFYLLEDALNDSIRLYDQLQNYLPKSWTVVSIDVCESTGDIIFFKYQNGTLNSFRLSPERWTTQGTEKNLNFQKLHQEFNEIIRLSSLSTKKEITARVKSKDQRQVWWKNRFHLDLKLKSLLNVIETHWVGGFGGIFEIAPDNSSFFALCKEVSILFEEVLGEHMDHWSLSDQEFVHILLTAQNSECTSFKLTEDVLRNTIKNFESLNSKKLEELTVGLRNIVNSCSKEVLKDDEECHYVLIPSSSCSFIPWESLSFMKNKSVSRMPTVQGLIRLLKSQIDSKSAIEISNQTPSVYYLINPEGDLKRTETTFGAKFRGQASSWEGLVGEAPTDGQLLQQLMGSDLFVYLGHGGCEQYIKTSDLLKLTNSKDSKNNLPPSFLIGCSSGTITKNGFLEPHANVYDWINGGAPMVMCNLWDVTDKDIDALSSSVFEKWGLFVKGEDDLDHINICQAVSQSREVCVLKHLNGCAPIVYGLPFKLKS